MSDIEERLRDNFETVYRVSHESKYGFHGNSTMWVAVEEETDDEIIGRKFGPMHDLPGSKVVIRKDNVAGWVEERHRYRRIPTEPPVPSPDEVKRAYLQGRINEEELETQMDDALEASGY